VTLSRLNSKAEITGQSSRSHDKENFAKVVDVTSTELGHYGLKSMFILNEMKRSHRDGGCHIW